MTVRTLTDMIILHTKEGCQLMFHLEDFFPKLAVQQNMTERVDQCIRHHQAVYQGSFRAQRTKLTNISENYLEAVLIKREQTTQKYHHFYDEDANRPHVPSMTILRALGNIRWINHGISAQC